MAAIGCALSFGVAEASAALGFCERASSGRACATLTVPLDRSGVVPGTVKLRIERQKAKRATRPPLFLLAGDAGQSATATFDSEMIKEIVGTEARSRDVVVMDLRGTGRSGLLDCPALQRGRIAGIAACAASLGAGRDFYTSADMADDIDTVRSELGVERIAALGISYGAHVALTYASRYPGRVDRLVLDSPVGLDGVDPFSRSSMRAAPEALGAQCGKRGCRSFTRSASADLRRLAARLERRPIVGLVTDRRGRRHRARLDGDGLLRTMTGEASAFLNADLPGGIHAALRGDAAPLLRSRAVAELAAAPPLSAAKRSATARLATLCSDTALPWTDATAIADRRESVLASVAALPPAGFAPFGPSAAAGEVVEACERWPSPVRRPTGAGTLPDVPALVLSGALDIRTPTVDARAVASLFPRGELLVAGTSPHAVVTFDAQGCAGPAVRRFLAGGRPGQCSDVPLFASLTPPPPSTLDQVRPVHGIRGVPGRTLRALELTLGDGYLSLVREFFGRLVLDPGANPAPSSGVWRLGALRGGSYVVNRQGFTFRRAAFVPGVRVTGTLRSGSRRPSVFQVSGSAAAPGRLTFRRGVLRGRLGDRHIEIRYDLDRVLLGALGIEWSQASAARLAALPVPR